MNFIFTFSNYFKRTFFYNKHTDTEVFIEHAINNKFSPSKQTLKNIKAFADCYSCKKTKTIGRVENILN